MREPRGTSKLRRATRGGSGRPRALPSQSPTPAAPMSKPAKRAGQHPLNGRRAATQRAPARSRARRVHPPTPAARPRMSCSRPRGSFVRQRRSRHFTFTGVSASSHPNRVPPSRMPTQYFGGRIARKRPLSAQALYITQPKAQISVLRSTDCPSLLRAHVRRLPITMPAASFPKEWSRSSVLAATAAPPPALWQPRSPHLHLASEVILMFAASSRGE